jgi:hypothetical protein
MMDQITNKEESNAGSELFKISHRIGFFIVSYEIRQLPAKII